MKKEDWIVISVSRLIEIFEPLPENQRKTLEDRARDYLSNMWDEVGEIEIEINEELDLQAEVSNKSGGVELYRDGKKAVFARKDPNMGSVVSILIINLITFGSYLLDIGGAPNQFLDDVQSQRVFIDPEGRREPSIVTYHDHDSTGTYPQWSTISGAYREHTLPDLLSGS